MTGNVFAKVYRTCRYRVDLLNEVQTQNRRRKVDGSLTTTDGFTRTQTAILFCRNPVWPRKQFVDVVDTEDAHVVPLGVVHQLRVQCGNDFSPPSASGILGSGRIDVQDIALAFLGRGGIVTILQQQLRHRVDDQYRGRIVDDRMAKHIQHRLYTLLHVLDLELDMLVQRNHQIPVGRNLVDDNVTLGELVRVPGDLLRIVDRKSLLRIQDLDERCIRNLLRDLLVFCVRECIPNGGIVQSLCDVRFDDRNTLSHSKRRLAALGLCHKDVDRPTGNADVVILKQRIVVFVANRDIAAGTIVQVHVSCRILYHAGGDIQRILFVLIAQDKLFEVVDGHSTNAPLFVCRLDG